MSSSRPRRIYTCALSPFEGNEMFFMRDSGLLCRSLEALGIESKVIMPARDGCDPSDIIRASFLELRDSEWWRSLGIDGVVFIAWGFRQHTEILRAARAAGVRTCALFDCNGDPFPYADLVAKPRILWRKGKFIQGFPLRLVGTAARVLMCAARGLGSHYHRSVQIGVPHIAAFQTPKTMERCLSVARLFPWIDSRSKALVLGYAIPDRLGHQVATRRRVNVVAVARWDALRHKRPHMLMKVIERVLALHSSVTFEIFGRLTPAMEQWHSGLEASLRERVSLQGIKPSAMVMDAIGSSQILYCPSVEEGVPLPVIEALCNGCSVAGLGTPAVPGLYWAFSEGHGSAARNDSVDAHAGAVLSELTAWEEGRRVPGEIAEHWKYWFSARNVAGRVAELIVTPDNPN